MAIGNSDINDYVKNINSFPIKLKSIVLYDMVLMQNKELLCDKLTELFNLGRKVERYPDYLQKIRDYKTENNSYRYSYFRHTHIGYILNIKKFQEPDKSVENLLDPKPLPYLGSDSSIMELPEFIYSIEVTVTNNPFAFF